MCPAAWEYAQTAECKRMSSVTVLLQLEELKSATERTGAERFVSKTFLKWLTLPEDITGFSTEHLCFVIDGNCSFSQLLRSSVSSLYGKKRRKNVWIDEGDFPTLSRDRKEHHCEQLPIPIALTLLFDSQYCYKRAACLSKRSLEEKLWVVSTIWQISPKEWNAWRWIWWILNRCQNPSICLKGHTYGHSIQAQLSWHCFDWQGKWLTRRVTFLWLKTNQTLTTLTTVGLYHEW